MPAIDKLLDQAIGSLEPTFGTHDLEVRARERRQRRRTTRAIATAVVGTLVAASVVAIATSRNDRVVVATRSGKSVFRENTGTVLAFSDGTDGLLVVDLDHSRAVRRPMGGGAPTETTGPIRVRDTFIVRDENGVAQSVPIDGSPRHALGTTTIAIDARGIGGVWLVDWPGGAIGAGTPSYRLVNIEGVVRATPSSDAPEIAPPDAVPAIGAGSFIVFESRDGARVWNTVTGEITVVGEGPTFIGEASASGRLFSWCSGPCNELHVVDLSRADQPVLDSLVGRVDLPGTFDVRDSSFSPHGRYLAVMTGADQGPLSSTSRGDLVVVDVLHGTQTTVARNIPRFSYVGWSPDGRQLFFSEYSWMQRSTDIGRFDLDSRTLETTTLPFGNVLLFRPLDQREAGAMLQAADSRPSACRSRNVYPSGRATACGFAFSAPKRAPHHVPSSLCLVTTRTDLGVGGASLYGGDPSEGVALTGLRAYIPNNGEASAERLPNSKYEFPFFWAAGDRTDQVRVRAKRLDGHGRSTFDFIPGHRSAIVSKPGCWRITGRVGSETLTVTLLITAG